MKGPEGQRITSVRKARTSFVKTSGGGGSGGNNGNTVVLPIDDTSSTPSDNLPASPRSGSVARIQLQEL